MKPLKALGQNFLINPHIAPRMAEMAGGSGTMAGVLEIGPGLGVLTKELASRFSKVVAVEIDERLIPVLTESLAPYKNVTLIHEDILKFDLPALISREFPDMDVYVCANLPYYITTDIIVGMLEARLPVKAMTFMVQKELAERYCATPGTRACGAVSLLVRYLCEPSILFHVSPGSFSPPPKVMSSVMRLDIRPVPAVSVSDEKRMFRLIRAGFSQRRKTLVNALSMSAGVDKAECLSALSRMGLDPNIRPEALTLENWAELTSSF